MPRHNKKQKKTAAQPPQADLDRFAGSSEEEDDDGDDAVDQDGESDTDVPPVRVDYAADAEETDESDEGSSDEGEGAVNRPKRVPKKAAAATDDESSDDDDDDSDAEVEATSGMATAMARILGTQLTKAPTVVLSKTKTPLQKQAELEKQREKELKDKKLVNRERNLAALHIPLSVATSASNLLSASSGLQEELQQERSHRRIATRGVVALFNAIAQHQHGHAAEAPAASAVSKKDAPSAKMTKNSFLDMIKSKAKAAAGATIDQSKTEIATVDDKKQWSAFRDDYMMDTKKPDWDKEDSSLEGGDDQDDDLSDESEHDKTRSLSKRRRV